MSTADSSDPRQSAEERLRSTVTENVRLALRLLFGLVVVFTPVVFILAPENIAYNAAPRAAGRALRALQVLAPEDPAGLRGALDRRAGVEQLRRLAQRLGDLHHLVAAVQQLHPSRLYKEGGHLWNNVQLGFKSFG